MMSEAANGSNRLGPVPRTVAGQLDRAERAVRDGRVEEALAEFRAASAAEENDPRPLLRMAVALEGLGLQPEALDALRTAVERAPREAAVWLFAGLAYADSGEKDSARQALSRCLELHPGNALAAAHLALLEFGDDRIGAPEMERKAAPCLWNDGFLARLLLERETRARSIGSHPSVSPLDVYPDFGEPGTRKARSAARSLLFASEELLRKGLFRSAIEHAETAVRLDPKARDRAALPLARAYFGLHEWDRAGEILDGAALDEDRIAEAEELRGELRRRRGEHEAAVAHFERGLEHAGDDPLARSRLELFRALSLVALQRFAEARAAFEVFAGLAPIDVKYEVARIARESIGRAVQPRGAADPEG